MIVLVVETANAETRRSAITSARERKNPTGCDGLAEARRHNVDLLGADSIAAVCCSIVLPCVV